MSLDYMRAGTTEDAIAALIRGGEDAKVVAGGTALVLMLQEGFIAPRFLVDIGRIAALGGIRDEGDAAIIGATTTLWQVMTSPLVGRMLPVLTGALGRVATVRIRSVATLGGNLAHGDPRLDPAAVLLALDASVRLIGPDGERWLRIDELFVDELTTAIGAAELLVEIRIPYPDPASRLTYRKLVGQTMDDYGVVNVAARLDVVDGRCRDARLVLGAVAATPIRVPAAEAVLRGAAIGPAVIAEAAELAREAADPVGDLRGSAGYKRDMVAVEVRRALSALAGGSTGRVTPAGRGSDS
jgi:carbon-monoxide dehydrogenase medium subunit